MKYDLLIKNIHVYCPWENIDYVGSIAINSGKITKLIPSIGSDLDAYRHVDGHGAYAVPGLIDAHMHINWKGCYSGVPADICCIPNGVTAAIDAGSTGVSNCPDLIDKLQKSAINAKIMLNVSAGGIIMSSQIEESLDPKRWDIKIFDRIFRDYGRYIVGLKLRLSKNVVKELGLIPLIEAKKLSNRYDVPIFVHPTDPPVKMDALVNELRPGDVLCHVYHDVGHTIFESEAVFTSVKKARERGVRFDLAIGRGHISLKNAERAIKEGFIPDTISSDITRDNWNNPLIYSLTITMSKMMAAGMRFEDVLKCTTANAAISLRDKDAGTLKEGTRADISLLQLRERELIYSDRYGNCIKGTKEIYPLGTIINGDLLYSSQDIY